MINISSKLNYIDKLFHFRKGTDKKSLVNLKLLNFTKAARFGEQKVCLCLFIYLLFIYLFIKTYLPRVAHSVH